MGCQCNLLATFGITNDATDNGIKHAASAGAICAVDVEEACIMKIVLPETCHGTALSDLRNMNITPATLFPGLDGFARSLGLLLRNTLDQDWDAKWAMFLERKPAQ
jgi:hypothetical protein